MATDSSAFLSPEARRYYRQMKAGLANKSAQPSGGISPDLEAYINSPSTDTLPPEQGGPKPHRNALLATLDVLLQPGYAATEIGLRKATGAAKEYQKAQARGEQGLETLPDIIKGFVGGGYAGGNPFGEGNDKLFFSDALRGSERFRQRMAEEGVFKPVVPGSGDNGPLSTQKGDSLAERIGKGTLGFAADVAGDPLTYVTLGMGGAALKAAGSGLSRAGLETVGGAVSKAGSGVTAADDFINALPGKAIDKAKTALGRGSSKAAQEAVSPSASVATKLDDAPVAESTVKQILEPETPVVPEGLTDLAARLKDSSGNIPNIAIQSTERHGLLPADRLLPTEDAVKPFSSRKLGQVRREVTPEEDLAHLRQGQGERYLSPFTTAPVARANTVPVEEVAARAPEVRIAEAVKAAEKRLSDPVTAAEAKAWVAANAKAEVSFTVPGSKNTVRMPIEAVRNRIAATGEGSWSAKTKAAANKAVLDHVKRSILAERAAAVREATEGASRVPDGVQDGLAGAPGVTGAGRGSSPVQAATDAQDALAGRSVVQRSPREIYNLKRRYQRALSDRAFSHLWDDGYLKDPALTAAQKQKEFEKRLRDLRKGLKTEEPAYYEVFYGRQHVVQPGRTIRPAPGTYSRIPVKSQRLNNELAQIKPASEAVREADTSIEAADIRLANDLLTGRELTDLDWRALRAVSGNENLGKPGVTGQQWTGRNPEFTETTRIQQTARNAETPGEGYGVNIESYNSKAQLNAFRTIFDDVRTRVDVDPPKRPNGKVDGWARGARINKEVTESLVRIETFLRAHNVEPIMGTLKTGVPFSMGDMLTAMNKTRLGRQFLNGRVFGGMYGLTPKGYSRAAGTVYLDDLMRVFEDIVDKLDVEAIVAAQNNVDVLSAIATSVVKTLKSGKVNQGTLANVLTDSNKKPITTVRPAETGGKQALKEGGYPVDVARNMGQEVPYIGKNTEGVVNELADAILGKDGDYQILVNVAQTIQARSAANNIRFGDNVAAITRDTLDEVVDFISETPSLKASVDLLSNPDAMTARAARARPNNPSDLEIAAAKKRVEEDLGEIISAWDRQGIRAYSQISRATEPVEVNRAALSQMEEVARQVDEIPNDEEFLSIADQVVQDTMTVWRRAGLWAIDNFALSKTIDGTTGRIRDNRIFREFNQAHSNNVNFSQNTAKALNAIQRMGSADEIRAAYQHIQRGGTGTVGPNISAIAEELRKVNAQYFDITVSGDDLTHGVLPTFLNRGFDLEHVTDKLTRSHFEFSDAEKFDWEKIAAQPSPMTKAIEFENQWKLKDIQDPIAFLGKMSAALSSINADMSISQNAWLKLKELDFVSTSYKPGMVKLKDLNQNSITRYFPAREVWIDKGIIPDIQRLDRVLNESLSFQPGGLAHTISKVYDPILSAWKAGMTIYRPGHHIRNLIGDMSLSFLVDGVKNPKYYTWAATMLQNRAKYDGVDLLRITQGLPAKASGLTGGGKGFNVHLGGKKLPVTLDEIYDAAMHRGILKDFSIQEDLIEATATPKWLKDVQNSKIGKPLGGRGRQFVGTVSQARDDFVRMAHFMHLMEHPPSSIKNMDELFDWAAARVDKSHPDGTGLTTVEKKYIRRVIPFYSWMRKSIPLVLEASAQRPGRVLIMPKAMYNAAQANGLQVESMSDPYPEDQLFPSWVTSHMYGPIYESADGQYWSASPGEVSSDTFGYLMGADPIGETLDMAFPLLKLPYELHSGQTLGQGFNTPGKDALQYIGSQIPGVSHVQSLTGTDILGSVPSLARGEGLDPTTQVQKGDRERLEANTLLNFLLGVGSRNLSTPSIINSAELEKRNEAKTAREAGR